MTLDPVAVDLLSQIGPRLAHTPKDGRLLDATEPADRLWAMLDEVTATILPRVLRFALPDQSCNLTVSNARVLGMPNPAEVAQKMRTLAETSGPLRVTSEPLGDAPAGEGSGCTRHELQTHCEMQGWLPGEGASPSPIAPFEDTLAETSIATANMSWDGTLGETSGDMDYLPDPKEMSALLTDFDTIHRQDNLSDISDPALLLIQNTKSTTASTLALFPTEKALRICVIPPSGIWPLARAWAAEQGEGQGR